MDMFAKLKKTASIVAVLLGCISLCACENSDSSKVTTASQSTVTSYNSNQNYVASQTEIVNDETAPTVTTSLSQSSSSSKTTTAKKTSSDSKTTTTASQSSSVSTQSSSVSSVTTDTETSQQTTSSEIEEPVVEPEIDITETANAQLLISQLPQKDLAVFEKINEAVNSFTREVTFKSGEATQQQVETALLMISLTNLEDHYVSPKYVISVDNLGNVSKLILEFTNTPQEQLYELTKLDKVVEEIISGCDAENDYDAVMYFHDEIIKRCRYDANAENMLSAYGCLVDGKAVCEGYAKALILLCTEYEIECVPITGNTTNSNGVVEPHMWNLVKLDDKWYHFDLTWDDPVSTLGDDFVKYDYFAVSDEVISIDHEITPIVYFTYPVADDSQNDYFTRKGLVYDDVDLAVSDFERVVSEAVSREDRFVRIRLSDAEKYGKFKDMIFESHDDKIKEIFNILAKASENTQSEFFNPRRYGKIFADDKNIITIVLNYE